MKGEKLMRNNSEENNVFENEEKQNNIFESNTKKQKNNRNFLDSTSKKTDTNDDDDFHDKQAERLHTTLIVIGIILFVSTIIISTTNCTNYTPTSYLLDVILTITICSLPIIIFRYAIKRSPIKKRAAIITVIIYGIVIYTALNAFVYFTTNEFLSKSSNSALSLWSFINYEILTSSSKRDKINSNKKNDKSITNEIENTNIIYKNNNYASKQDINITNQIKENRNYIVQEEKEPKHTRISTKGIIFITLAIILLFSVFTVALCQNSF